MGQRGRAVVAVVVFVTCSASGAAALTATPSSSTAVAVPPSTMPATMPSTPILPAGAALHRLAALHAATLRLQREVSSLRAQLNTPGLSGRRG